MRRLSFPMNPQAGFELKDDLYTVFPQSWGPVFKNCRPTPPGSGGSIGKRLIFVHMRLLGLLVSGGILPFLTYETLTRFELQFAIDCAKEIEEAIIICQLS